MARLIETEIFVHSIANRIPICSSFQKRYLFQFHFLAHVGIHSLEVYHYFEVWIFIIIWVQFFPRKVPHLKLYLLLRCWLIKSRTKRPGEISIAFSPPLLTKCHSMLLIFSISNSNLFFDKVWMPLKRIRTLVLVSNLTILRSKWWFLKIEFIIGW